MKFSKFDKYPDLIYGISEKSDGAMELGRQILNGIRPGNRQAHFRKLGIPYKRAVGADLVHSVRVLTVGEKEAGKTISETDGLITKSDNLFLTITIADCFPLYLFDPKSKVIGLIHAGWRGISKNIIKEAIKILKHLGVDLNNLLIGIGPGIRECHFEVKPDVGELFGTRAKFLDLTGIIQEQLIEIGVPKRNIEDSKECTYCLEQKYFSYRRDKPEQVEAMIAHIGRKYD